MCAGMVSGAHSFRQSASLAILRQDSTSSSMTHISTTLALLGSLLLGLIEVLLSARHANTSTAGDSSLSGTSLAHLPLFMIVVFFVLLSTISLPLHVYRASVDALIVAYSLCSDTFSTVNSTVYLRFLRVSEGSEEWNHL